MIIQCRRSVIRVEQVSLTLIRGLQFVCLCPSVHIWLIKPSKCANSKCEDTIYLLWGIHAIKNESLYHCIISNVVCGHGILLDFHELSNTKHILDIFSAYSFAYFRTFPPLFLRALVVTGNSTNNNMCCLATVLIIDIVLVKCKIDPHEQWTVELIPTRYRPDAHELNLERSTQRSVNAQCLHIITIFIWNRRS